MKSSVLRNLNPGKNSVTQNVTNLSEGGTYFITVETTGEKATQKMNVECSYFLFSDQFVTFSLITDLKTTTSLTS
jgi:hypothetical protein